MRNLGRGFIVLAIFMAYGVNQSSGFIDKIIKFVDKTLVKFDREVIRRGIKEPLETLGKEIIEKPIRSILEVIGVKKVRKTYREFKQEVEHARVVVTEDSYRVEKVTPCHHGHHDIVKAEQPVEFHFEDKVVVVQDRYCRKCGQHFFTEPRDEL
ncbi:uncharacterized protein LOC110232456 [Exaiptasia diaphana]|uniref:Uncharacterized protein n=1 Tax=Exaiptasia diaphana TaxID=2652724 RepID=A0A913WS81_EXADI|nr:uncharacterized protein LOC110232456 [Exaiptasia diaphana]